MEKRGIRRRLALATVALTASAAVALATPAVADEAPAATGVAPAATEVAPAVTNALHTARVWKKPGKGPAPTACYGRKVRTFPFRTGTVVVYKRPGYVCAVTLAERPGGRQKISVTVQARGNAAVTRGWVNARTSPAVTVHAGHRCVRVAGRVGRGEVKSGWILC
ncbi:hypothetical protein IAG44_26160 [Streptomyces roseirectus]|uniref:Secreted protein n=2 Tax=Streptomyces roseirectus TaxID=2768066 RepID=A0A7H0IT31_9ACTN|nr:hypothetical protein IAG44_26160 [Streptomyces roseirectus]